MFSIPAKFWLGFYFISFFFIWGVFLPFWGVWLEAQGLSSDDIGILFSIGLMLRFVSSVGLLPNVSTGAGSLRLLRVLAFFVVLAFSFLLYQREQIWLSIITLVVNFLLAPMMPLGDIIGNRLVKQINLDYGRVRLWGSLSFIVGSTCIGWLIVQYGKEAILWTIIIASLVMWILTLFQLSPGLEDGDNTHKKHEYSLFSLFKRRNVLLFVLIVGGIQGAHGAYYAFSSIYWARQGIPEVTIAWLWGISVCAEVVLMRFNTKFFSRWTIKQMFLLGLIASIIRWFVFSQTTDVYILGVVQIFHAMTFAVTHLATIRYIGLQNNADMVRYQSLYSGVGLGLMTALFTYISGTLFESLQGNIFLIMSILLIPILWFLKIWEIESEQS